MDTTDLKIRHISRCDYEGMKGWYVRRRGKNQYFSDSRWGGVEGALAQAKMYLESLRDEDPPRIFDDVYGLTMTTLVKNHTRRYYLNVQAKAGPHSLNTRYAIRRNGMRKTIWKVAVQLSAWCELYKPTQVLPPDKRYKEIYRAVNDFIGAYERDDSKKLHGEEAA